MKILMVNTTDAQGGAARATRRLFAGLKELSVDCSMLVKKKESVENNIIEIGKKEKFLGLIAAELDIFPLKFYKERDNNHWSTALISAQVIKRINNFDCDIVHLHWVYSGFLSISDIAKIKKPLIWTLHDSWPFTGGCHVPGECKRYMQECGDCPILNAKKKKDLSYKILKKKKNKWKNINFNIVAPSKWIGDCAKKSSLFKNSNVDIISNGINMEVFKETDRKIAKEILSLSNDKKYILFGAMNALTDKNKGFQYFKKALHELSDQWRDNVEILIFGSSESIKNNDLKFKTKYFGKINDDITLSLLYSASDVTIVPSIQESFGQTASESLSCSRPVVCFNSSGLKDIVDHKINGYLAEFLNEKDLARGIEWVLKNENYEDLCRNARKKVVENFDINIIAGKYKKLYEEILKSDK